MKKIISMVALVALVAFGGICRASEKEAINVKPGAMVSVYQQFSDCKIPADAVPIEVSIDTQESWCQENLRQCADLAKYANWECTVVWDGFLPMPAKGAYAFSLTPNRVSSTSIVVQIKGENFLVSNGAAATGIFHAEKGHYPIRVIFTSRGWKSESYTLKYWLKTSPFKKTVVTPATLFHAE